MKKYHPEKRSVRVMAIAAKRQGRTRTVMGYDSKEYGAVNSEGVFQGGTSLETYRLGDLMRRTARFALIERTRYTKEQRRNTVDSIRALRTDGY